MGYRYPQKRVIVLLASSKTTSRRGSQLQDRHAPWARESCTVLARVPLGCLFRPPPNACFSFSFPSQALIMLLGGRVPLCCGQNSNHTFWGGSPKSKTWTPCQDNLHKSEDGSRVPRQRRCPRLQEAESIVVVAHKPSTSMNHRGLPFFEGHQRKAAILEPMASESSRVE